MTATFLLRHFLIELNGPTIVFWFVLIFNVYQCQPFLVSGCVGVEDSSFLMERIFSFLTGTIMLPVETILEPGFCLPP